METLYELEINGHTIVSTYNIHEFLTARKSALMALTIVGINYDSYTIKGELSASCYFLERVHTKA